MKPTEAQLAAIVERIVGAVHPQKIILFGSNARGEGKPNSDIDVLVVMPDGAHRRQTTTQIYRAMLGSKLDVDVVVANASDLAKYADTSGLVYKEALREGVSLYAA